MSQPTDYKSIYLRIGNILGALLGIVVFIGTWFYSISEAGYLVGIALGWILALAAAATVRWMATLLWGPLLALVLFALISDGWRDRAPKGNGWEVVSEEPLVTAADAAATAAQAAADAAATPAQVAAAAQASAASAAAQPPVYAPPARYYYEPSGAYEASRGDADCTDDCSGHEAGYQWAEENDITDEGDCGGDSDSFIEGCIAYVEDNE